jgi:hypothetical protein
MVICFVGKEYGGCLGFIVYGTSRHEKSFWLPAKRASRFQAAREIRSHGAAISSLPLAETAVAGALSLSTARLTAPEINSSLRNHSIFSKLSITMWEKS